MLGSQISVAVAHQPSARTRLEPVPPGVEKGTDEVLGRVQPARFEHARPRVAQRRHILIQGRLESGERATSADGHRRRGMKPGEQGGRRRDMRCPQASRNGERGEASILLHPSHLDRVLACGRVVLGGQQPTVAVAADTDHAQADPGGEPPVEAHLLAAHLPTPLERPVVEEGEHEWLLHLVGEVAREKDPGDVGLAQLHR